jgi:hypothetical protein
MSRTKMDGVGYRVEARVSEVSVHAPAVLPDGLVTTEWRALEFSKGSNPAGVPVHYLGYDLTQFNLLPFESAVALAWTVVAQNQWKFLEIRIVQHAFHMETTVERGAVVDMEIGKPWGKAVPLVKQPDEVAR